MMINTLDLIVFGLGFFVGYVGVSMLIGFLYIRNLK